MIGPPDAYNATQDGQLGQSSDSADIASGTFDKAGDYTGGAGNSILVQKLGSEREALKISGMSNSEYFSNSQRQ